MESSRLVCLNLGCGNDLRRSTEKEEWINLDRNPPPSYGKIVKDSIFNVGSLWPAGTFDVIYSKYVFEHIELKQLCDLLYQLHSVLKPDGVLQVVVPDFLEIVRSFDRSCKEEDQSYDVWTEVNFRVFGEARETFHKTVWTRNSAPMYLRQCGFFVPHFQEQKDDGDFSLVYECEKR